jgi:LacI family transcriptional regulator
MRTSLKELAIKSGYSVNTVSRALRDADDVKASTKSLIKQLADEMGYIPNVVAKNLRLGKTNTIGVVSADSSNPYFAEVILGIEDAARSHDYHMLLVNTEESPEGEREAIDTLIERQVDGLLIIPVFGEDANLERLKSLPVPFLLVGRWLPGLEDHSILTDEYEKAKQVTSLFLANGHRHVLHLAGPSFVSSSFDRMKGYKDAHSEAGIPVNEDLIVETDGHIEDGHRSINALIRKELPFSALFAFNDLVAIGAMRALKEAGYLIPQDVEVVGFDDLDLSRYLYNSLSSVRIPKQELGRIAFESLFEHMTDPNKIYRRQTIESRLMLRETTTFENIGDSQIQGGIK